MLRGGGLVDLCWRWRGCSSHFGVSYLEPSEDPRAYGDYTAEFPVPTHDDILAAHRRGSDEEADSGDPPGGPQTSRARPLRRGPY